MTLKLALFIDGKNFFSGWRDAVPDAANSRVDFFRMSRWIANNIHADSRIVSCNYYTGVNRENDLGLNAFLNNIQKTQGFHVNRFNRQNTNINCFKCGHPTPMQREKEVDTQLVADMISMGLKNVFDVAVLCSGDLDFRPAIRALRLEGKPVWIAHWDPKIIAQELREEAYGTVLLSDGQKEFVQLKDKGSEDLEIESDVLESLKEKTYSAIKTLYEKFKETGYAGKGYFISKWIAHDLDAAILEVTNDREAIPDFRQQMINQLVADGRIEIRQVENTKTGRADEALIPL